MCDIPKKCLHTLLTHRIFGYCLKIEAYSKVEKEKCYILIRMILYLLLIIYAKILPIEGN